MGIESNYYIQEAEAEGDWEFNAEVECTCGHYEADIDFMGYYVGNTAFGTYVCTECGATTEVETDISDALAEGMEREYEREEK